MSSDGPKGWPFDWLDRLPAWGKLFAYPVAIPLMLAYGMVMMGCFLACLPFFLAGCLWAHRRFLKKLRQAGRVVTWAEIEGELAAGRGTLILVESIRTQFDIVWWVDEPVALTHPEHPLPTYRAWLADRSSGAHEVFTGLDESFAWYQEKYLDAELGKACWTRVPRNVWDRLDADFPERSVLVALLY